MTVHVDLVSGSVAQLNLAPSSPAGARGRFNWKGVATVSWDDKRLPYVVTAFSETSEDEETREWKMKSGAVAAASAGTLSAFSFNRVETGSAVRVRVNEPTPVEVSNDFALRLRAQWQVHELACRSFRHALDAIEQFATNGHPDPFILFAFVHTILDAAFRVAWGREDLDSIARDLSVLSQAKLSETDRFDAQRGIQARLRILHCPDAWIARPPTLVLP